MQGDKFNVFWQCVKAAWASAAQAKSVWLRHWRLCTRLALLQSCLLTVCRHDRLCGLGVNHPTNVLNAAITWTQPRVAALWPISATRQAAGINSRVPPIVWDTGWPMGKSPRSCSVLPYTGTVSNDQWENRQTRACNCFRCALDRLLPKAAFYRCWLRLNTSSPKQRVYPLVDARLEISWVAQLILSPAEWSLL